MALLNAVNTATQAVVANGFIAYTATNVKQGCGIKFNDGSNTISLKVIISNRIKYLIQ